MACIWQTQTQRECVHACRVQRHVHGVLNRYGFTNFEQPLQKWTFQLFTSGNQLVSQHFFLCGFLWGVFGCCCCCCCNRTVVLVVAIFNSMAFFQFSTSMLCCCHLPTLWCLQQISIVIYCRDACEYYSVQWQQHMAEQSDCPVQSSSFDRSIFT